MGRISVGGVNGRGYGGRGPAEAGAPLGPVGPVGGAAEVGAGGKGPRVAEPKGVLPVGARSCGGGGGLGSWGNACAGANAPGPVTVVFGERAAGARTPSGNALPGSCRGLGC